MIAKIQVKIVEGPLSKPFEWDASDEHVGAVLTFEGIVRREEAGRDLKSLRYDAYEPMTQNELQKLSTKIAQEFELIALYVEHSVGIVRVGEISFRLTLTSSHRAEAIAACDAFIIQMKETIPLWKTPLYSDG